MKLINFFHAWMVDSLNVFQLRRHRKESRLAEARGLRGDLLITDQKAYASLAGSILTKRAIDQSLSRKGRHDVFSMLAFFQCSVQSGAHLSLLLLFKAAVLQQILNHSI